MVIIGGIHLPNSCLRILEILSGCSSEGISQQQLITETGLSERAVKYALKELVIRKLANSAIVLDDTRRKVYRAGVGR